MVKPGVVSRTFCRFTKKRTIWLRSNSGENGKVVVRIQLLLRFLDSYCWVSTKLFSAGTNLGPGASFAVRPASKSIPFTRINVEIDKTAAFVNNNGRPSIREKTG